ncbi:MAG TPA: PAS domain S-box protein [Gemmatimonadales bacterium]
MSNLGFRLLLEAALDATVVVDSLGRIVALNHEAERLFGWIEQELVGQPMTRLIPTRFHRILDTPPVFNHEQAETQPKGWRVSLFARRRTGSEFPVEIHRGPLGSGTDPLVLVTIRDLTEWRRAQESLFREKEQALITLESIGDAVITTDTAGRMLYLNPMAERLTGWRTTEALGMPSAGHSHFRFRPHQGTAREHGCALSPGGTGGGPGRWRSAAAAGRDRGGNRRLGGADPGPQRRNHRSGVGLPRRDRETPGITQALT